MKPLKYLLEQLEKEKGWTRKFPILSQSPNFPPDEHSLSKCKGRNAKCCFLTYPYQIYGKIPEADDFKEFYDRKNFAILKHNLENMFDYGYKLFDGMDSKEFTMLGNSNWARIYSKAGADIRTSIVAFACPLLTKDHKCTVYPKRFEICKNGNAELFCDLETVYEVKKC